MVGIIYSIIAGIFISLQSVFNSRVGDKIGLLETTVIVHGIGFFVALSLLLGFGWSGINKIGEVSKIYLLGGAFGVIIVFSVMKGIERLGVAYSISVLIVTQLIVGLFIDSLGLFGAEKINLTYTKPLGLIIMLVGLIIFKIV